MLWIFGDSFGGVHCNLKDRERVKNEFPYAEYTWQYMLAQKLEQPYKIRALGGGSNDDTFKILVKYLHRIQPGDTVVVILTSCTRHLKVIHPFEQNLNNLKAPLLIYNEPPSQGEGILTSVTFDERDKKNKDLIHVVNLDRLENRDVYIYYLKDYWTSWVSYFLSRKIKCLASGHGAMGYYVHPNLYESLDDSYFCDCRHWNRKGHKHNFDILSYALDNNMAYIDLAIIEHSGPEELKPLKKVGSPK